MKTRALISCLLCLLLVGAAVAAEKAPVNDDVIYDNVRRRLASDQVVKGGALMVDVKDGVVTLSGMVEQEKQKDRATKLTKKVSGVKSVNNELQIGRKGALK